MVPAPTVWHALHDAAAAGWHECAVRCSAQTPGSSSTLHAIHCESCYLPVLNKPAAPLPARRHAERPRIRRALHGAAAAGGYQRAAAVPRHWRHHARPGRSARSVHSLVCSGYGSVLSGNRGGAGMLQQPPHTASAAAAAVAAACCCCRPLIVKCCKSPQS